MIPGISGSLDAQEDPLFSLHSERSVRRGTVRVRPNQWRFRFDVLKRYGTVCAVCAIERSELLEAAHLCPVEDAGSDDARNGLVFCLTHHRAFDTGLFRIAPETLDVVLNGGATSQDLGITRPSIAHLKRSPHREALDWAWRRGRKRDAQGAGDTAGSKA
jgi:hypothetical protein